MTRIKVPHLQAARPVGTFVESNLEEPITISYSTDLYSSLYSFLHKMRFFALAALAFAVMVAADGEPDKLPKEGSDDLPRDSEGPQEEIDGPLFPDFVHYEVVDLNN